MGGHARSWPWCCFLHVYRLEAWGLLLLGCFFWSAVLAVAGLASLLVALAAVLLPLLPCTAAADYSGRCWCWCAVLLLLLLLLLPLGRVPCPAPHLRGHCGM